MSRAADIARAVLGTPALVRDADGLCEISQDARRTMYDIAIRSGRLVTVDVLAAMTGTTRQEVLDAVRSERLDPVPSDGRGRLLFDSDAASGYAFDVRARRDEASSEL